MGDDQPHGKQWGQDLPKNPIHNYRIVVIDSCEYIEVNYVYDKAVKYSLTHKGNCKNHINKEVFIKYEHTDFREPAPKHLRDERRIYKITGW